MNRAEIYDGLMCFIMNINLMLTKKHVLAKYSNHAKSDFFEHLIMMQGTSSSKVLCIQF